MRRIEKDELKQGDGLEGRPALVAFEGKVYDVSRSKLWRGGKHMNSHLAGRDLTSAMDAAPHGTDVLERFELVGELAGAREHAHEHGAPHVPALIAKLLPFHPHHVSVHFPIALCLTAALFTAIELIFKNASMETVAFYNLIVATIGAYGGIATGLITWRYNFGGTWTPLLRKKVALSVVLVVLTAAALVIRLAAVDDTGQGGAGYWAYTALRLALAPTVAGLGYFGGKMGHPA